MRATSLPPRTTSIVSPAATRSKHRPARVRSSSSPTHPPTSGATAFDRSLRDRSRPPVADRHDPGHQLAVTYDVDRLPGTNPIEVTQRMTPELAQANHFPHFAPIPEFTQPATRCRTRQVYDCTCGQCQQFGPVLKTRRRNVPDELPRFDLGRKMLYSSPIQPAGASMSFHPSSPIFLESSTAYLAPSGPTSSPLCGL